MDYEIGHAPPRGMPEIPRIEAEGMLTEIAGKSISIGENLAMTGCPETCPACGSSEVWDMGYLEREQVHPLVWVRATAPQIPTSAGPAMRGGSRDGSLTRSRGSVPGAQLEPISPLSCRLPTSAPGRQRVGLAEWARWGATTCLQTVWL